MYSFVYTSKFVSPEGKDNYLLHILFDDVIIDSRFVQFPLDTLQDALDSYANSIIDSIEGIE